VSHADLGGPCAVCVSIGSARPINRNSGTVTTPAACSAGCNVTRDAPSYVFVRKVARP
jgi:hypothetical protein